MGGKNGESILSQRSSRLVEKHPSTRPSAAIFLFHGGIPPCIYLGAGDSSAFGGFAQDDLLVLRYMPFETVLFTPASISYT
jgi:hypothetical protein